MKSKQLLTICGIGAAVILLIIIALFAGKVVSPAPTYDPSTQAQENGGPKTIPIGNTSKLADILLSEQLTAVQDKLRLYISSHVGDNVSSAAIIGDPVIGPDGNIDLTVQTTNPAKTFSFHIDRSQYNSLTMSVPGTDFQATVVIYGAGSNLKTSGSD